MHKKLKPSLFLLLFSFFLSFRSRCALFSGGVGWGNHLPPPCIPYYARLRSQTHFNFYLFLAAQSCTVREECALLVRCIQSRFLYSPHCLPSHPNPGAGFPYSRIYGIGGSPSIPLLIAKGLVARLYPNSGGFRLTRSHR